MALNRRFWARKKVFLTGHTGFKGSWLALWLRLLGCDVVGYASGIPTSPSLYEIASVGDGLVSIDGDIRDRRSLAEALAEYRPEIVLHLASQPLVRRSYVDPITTYETNVIGTVNLLDSARFVESIRVILNVTSDKCYRDRGSRSYNEDDPLGGSDPYSSSKSCSELVTLAYRRSFFQTADRPAIASARAGNVIGGGDWAEDRLVPDLMRGVLEGEVVHIRNPLAVRPWQHVLNPLEGYLLLVEHLWEDRGYAGAWNFGPQPDDHRDVRWIVERLSALWGEPISCEADYSEQPTESQTLRLDCARARARLGWEGHWDLDHALTSIVDWYRAYAAGEHMQDIVLRQIRTFEAGTALASAAQ
jgi:CDP-glucose 4,6-dehydratase